MICLKRIHAYVPPKRVHISDLRDRLGLDAHQVRIYNRMFGLSTIAVAEDMDLPRLLEQSLMRLMDDDSVRPDRIKGSTSGDSFPQVDWLYEAKLFAR